MFLTFLLELKKYFLSIRNRTQSKSYTVLLIFVARETGVQVDCVTYSNNNTCRTKLVGPIWTKKL
jgi:hypothetical protein